MERSETPLEQRVESLFWRLECGGGLLELRLDALQLGHQPRRLAGPRRRGRRRRAHHVLQHQRQTLHHDAQMRHGVFIPLNL